MPSARTSGCPRSSAPATTPTSPPTTSCSTGRTTRPPASACSRWTRSATHGSSPGSPAGWPGANLWWCSPPAGPTGRRTAGSAAPRHASDQAVDALFRQAGVMVVHRRGAMIDIAKIATRQPLPSGPRVRIITNSQTLAQQMIQAAEAVGLLPGRAAGAAGVGGGPGGVRGRRARGAGRPGVRLGGVRGGQRFRPGHHRRDRRPGGCRDRGDQATRRGLPRLPRPA